MATNRTLNIMQMKQYLLKMQARVLFYKVLEINLRLNGHRRLSLKFIQF